MRTNQEIAASMREQLSTAFIEQASGLRSDINEVVQRVFEAGLAESNAGLERELADARREKIQFLELYKLMPEIENQYEDRIYYHLANKLQQNTLHRQLLSSNDLITKERHEELKRADGRLQKAMELIWETRWVTDHGDYQTIVGIAAEIRSGNFSTIDAAISNNQNKQNT